MTPADLLTIRTLLGLSQTELAHALGLKSRSAIARWEAGTHVMGAGHVKLLRYLIDQRATRLLTLQPETQELMPHEKA